MQQSLNMHDSEVCVCDLRMCVLNRDMCHRLKLWCYQEQREEVRRENTADTRLTFTELHREVTPPQPEHNKVWALSPDRWTGDTLQPGHDVLGEGAATEI